MTPGDVGGGRGGGLTPSHFSPPSRHSFGKSEIRSIISNGDSPVKVNRPEMYREIRKERHPTMWGNTLSAGNLSRMSMERRASFTHLDAGKPSPVNNSFGVRKSSVGSAGGYTSFGL